jgi:hypothetical protein
MATVTITHKYGQTATVTTGSATTRIVYGPPQHGNPSQQGLYHRTAASVYTWQYDENLAIGAAAVTVWSNGPF